MWSRFAVAIMLVGIGLPPPSRAQQITSDVVIPGATLNDGYMAWICDSEGQLYRRPTGRGASIMRVAKDGSTLLFTLPEPETSIGVFAPARTGLTVLNSHYSRAEGVSYKMYRFDVQGTLVAQYDVSLDFQPLAMAVISSGKTIVVGYRPRVDTDQEARTYVGALLDVEGQLQIQFDFPPSPDGLKWTPVNFPRMAGGDAAAHLIFQTGAEPSFAIARITESGKVDFMPLKTVRGAGFHDWFFGNGVAAENFQFSVEKPPGATHWDAYDLSSGKRISTKTLLPAGFSIGCYLGDEVSVLAHSAQVEKSRGLPPEALRLVTVKLE